MLGRAFDRYHLSMRQQQSTGGTIREAADCGHSEQRYRPSMRKTLSFAAVHFSVAFGVGYLIRVACALRTLTT